jgi:arylsulfatase B
MRRNLDVDRSYNQTYATEMFTNEAINLIASHNKSQPLFLLLNHLAPHAANEHHPLQAPEEIIKMYEYIPDLDRRTLAGKERKSYCFIFSKLFSIWKRLEQNKTINTFISQQFSAMMHVLDKGVGAVVRALRDARMLKNTVIVFQSDNGGPVTGLHATDSSNWPLRGVKI